jgi:hypothetical protein
MTGQSKNKGIINYFTRPNRRAQAVTELAIFGSLLIMGFAVLMSYAQTLKEQQIAEMSAFRKAESKAYNANGYVSYQVMKDKRFVSPGADFGDKQRSTISGSGSVFWANVNDDGGKQYSYIKLNEDEIPLQGWFWFIPAPIIIGGNGDQAEDGFQWKKFSKPVQVYDIGYVSQSDAFFPGFVPTYKSEFIKKETEDEIITTRSATSKEAIWRFLRMRKADEHGNYTYLGEVPYVQTLYTDILTDQEKYSLVPLGIIGSTQGRTWTTTHE